VHPVAVRILHPASRDLEPLERALFDARTENADRLAVLFHAAGAADVEIVHDSRPRGTFGAAVRTIVQAIERGGLVLLGSGAIPLATAADVAALVAVGASAERRALANNRYSADVVAIGDASALRDLPELPGDNALPRWLEEVAGFEVTDLRRRWRLAVDLDSPLDVLLAGSRPRPPGRPRAPGQPLPGFDVAAVGERLAAIRTVAGDRRGQLVVTGRTSATTLRWLERRTAARVRALVEERGLRASSTAALGGTAAPGGDPAPPRRPTRSILGMVLDDRGPEALGPVLAELGDAAIVDSRVLLAHRLGVGEGTWPRPEDRFASDLLLPARVSDPWLRALTAAALGAPIPVLLGGHTLVGPGVRLALGARP